MFRMLFFTVAAIYLPKYPILLVPLVLALYGCISFKKYVQGGQCNCKHTLDGRLAIITGGNAGIGLATAKLLAKKGCNVIITCRNITQGKNIVKILRTETLNKSIECMQLDLANFASIHEFAYKIATKESKIDFLICNAGIGWNSDEPAITCDGQEQIFQTNYLGHFLLTNLLLDLLTAAENARVISVAGLSYLWDTSVIPYDDLTWKVTSWNSLAAYGQSNLARVLFTRELSRRAKLNGDKLTSYAVHPGIVATRFNQKEKDEYVSLDEKIKLSLQDIYEKVFYKTPESGAQTILHCCLSQELANQSGRFYMECKEVEYEGDLVKDREEAIKLWNVSLNLVENPTPVSPSDVKAADKNNEWKYVGRKRRTAL